MRVANFSLFISEGREQDSGHVVVPHGSKFKIRLGNHDYNRRCDADVSVDGKSVGCFRIDGGGTITLERPSGDTGCFTFYKAESAEGQSVGGGIARDDRGLVSVTFKPERQRVKSVSRGAGGQSCGGTLRSMSMFPASCGTASVAPQNMAAGVTGLSGTSSQRFTTVASLDYDPDAEVTITVRLVAGDDSPRVLKDERVRSNPVPAPVE